MSLIKCFLCCILIFSLNSCSKIDIKPGYYLLTSINENSTNGSWFSPQLGYLIVNQDNTLTFPFVDKIEGENLNNDIFEYTIKGENLILTQGNFTKEYPIKSKKENNLNIDLKDDGTRSLDFTLQKLEFRGQYNSGGFATNKNKDSEIILEKTQGIFSGVLLDFAKNEEEVTLKPELAYYLIGDSTNNKYSYVVKGHSLVLNNGENKYKIDFFYDGMLHLLPEDKYINRIDLGLID